ncbi:MAG: Uma2 family endonuclease [Planctomycetes bacterium]|nr:Uma2 family endonuclease [Planctomycetota bacterium]
MATATPAVEKPRSLGLEDHIVVFEGVTWADYQRLLEIRGDKSAPRISYLEGRVEIMCPSRYHENYKSLVGRLVETWCLERGIEFTTLGAWTLEEKELDRGVEPDECYVFGEKPQAKRPDLAIEVIWTHGGLNKLEIYRKLGVREVWIWKDGELTPHVLRGEQYAPARKSKVLPDIDLAELASFLDRPTTSRAIRDYRAALRRGG